MNDQHRPGLNNITSGLAAVFGDLGKGLIDFLNRLTDQEGVVSENGK